MTRHRLAGGALLAEAGETARLHDQVPESRIVCGEAGLEAIEQSMDAPVAHLVVDIDEAVVRSVGELSHGRVLGGERRDGVAEIVG